MAAALKFIHSRDIVHLDVKLESFWLYNRTVTDLDDHELTNSSNCSNLRLLSQSSLCNGGTTNPFPYTVKLAEFGYARLLEIPDHSLRVKHLGGESQKSKVNCNTSGVS